MYHLLKFDEKVVLSKALNEAAHFGWHQALGTYSHIKRSSTMSMHKIDVRGSEDGSKNKIITYFISL